MSIGSIHFASASPSGGFQVRTRDQQETAPVCDNAPAGHAPRKKQAEASATSQDNANPLSRNFVSTTFEQSKYIQSTLSGLQMENSFSNSMDSLLTSMSAQFEQIKAQLGGEGSKYAAAHILGHRTRDNISRLIERDIAERSEQGLEETQEAIEQQAQEAVEPQDDSNDSTRTDVSTEPQLTTSTELSLQATTPEAAQEAPSAPVSATVDETVASPTIPAINAPAIDIVV